jgi:hypothetical protein
MIWWHWDDVMMSLWHDDDDVMWWVDVTKSVDMKKRPFFEPFLGPQNGALFGAVRNRGAERAWGAFMTRSMRHQHECWWCPVTKSFSKSESHLGVGTRSVAKRCDAFSDPMRSIPTPGSSFHNTWVTWKQARVNAVITCGHHKNPEGGFVDAEFHETSHDEYPMTWVTITNSHSRVTTCCATTPRSWSRSDRSNWHNTWSRKNNSHDVTEWHNNTTQSINTCDELTHDTRTRSSAATRDVSMARIINNFMTQSYWHQDLPQRDDITATPSHRVASQWRDPATRISTDVDLRFEKHAGSVPWLCWGQHQLVASNTRRRHISRDSAASDPQKFWES